MGRLAPRRAQLSGAAGVTIALVLGVGACAQATTGVPAACLTGPGAIVGALASAPGPVTLGDGTPLSRCVARARSAGDVQELGTLLSAAADSLEAQARVRRSAGAALRLGYLIGSVERGGRSTQGVSAELIRRVEQDAGALAGAPPFVVSNLRRGLAAGRLRG